MLKSEDFLHWQTEEQNVTMLSPGSLLQFDWHGTGEGREMMSCIFTRNKQRMKTYGNNTHARIQDFLSEGSRPDGQKTAWTTFFFVFFSPHLFYSLQRGSNSFITEKTNLFQGSRRGPTFFRGVQMLISIETHKTYERGGGGGGGGGPAHDTSLQIRVHIWKLFFLFLNQNICLGTQKNRLIETVSFEHPKHMFKLMGKETNAI